MFTATTQCNSVVGATFSQMSVVATNHVIISIYFRSFQLYGKACFRKACILRLSQIKSSKTTSVDKIFFFLQITPLRFKRKFTLHYAFEPSLAQLCVLRLLKI